MVISFFFSFFTNVLVLNIDLGRLDKAKVMINTLFWMLIFYLTMNLDRIKFFVGQQNQRNHYLGLLLVMMDL